MAIEDCRRTAFFNILADAKAEGYQRNRYSDPGEHSSLAGNQRTVEGQYRPRSDPRRNMCRPRSHLSPVVSHAFYENSFYRLINSNAQNQERHKSLVYVR
jgi:hypothetical protein